MTSDPELLRMREQMDDVNLRLVHVLHERARLSRRIGARKQTKALTVIDPAREQEMLARLLRELPPDGFSEAALTSILRAVFAASRDLVAAPND
tara:strand:+ start:26216 stop:26497 length:282 start_codon:yes stop_codon:yes gene_type:complete